MYSRKPVKDLTLESYIKNNIERDNLERKKNDSLLLLNLKYIESIVRNRQKIIIEPNKTEIERLKKELQYYKNIKFIDKDTNISLNELFKNIESDLK